jgi:hypothetical protein
MPRNEGIYLNPKTVLSIMKKENLSLFYSDNDGLYLKPVNHEEREPFP